MRFERAFHYKVDAQAYALEIRKWATNVQVVKAPYKGIWVVRYNRATPFGVGDRPLGGN